MKGRSPRGYQVHVQDVEFCLHVYAGPDQSARVDMVR